MSIGTRRELAARWRAEYAKSGKARKGEILGLLCQQTGWNRKHAMAALKGLPEHSPKQGRKRRAKYGPNEEAALVKVWILSDALASKRLAPFMQEFLEALERHGELRLPEPVRSKLVQMSASTMDRLLKRHRASYGRGISSTRPGNLLKRQIAVHVGAWNEDRPGFFEVDTVAHCGGSLEGEHCWTLSMTDMATGWFESAALKNRSQTQTLLGIKSIRTRLPFPLLGLDVDNGSEFVNWHLKDYCDAENIGLTRCRPYHKNDQCRIEQKNSSVVRKHTGYGRYDQERQLSLLRKIHGLLRLTVNFFEPSSRGKDKAKTPYRRLAESGILGPEQEAQLEKTYLQLNPVALRRELREAKMELFEIESLVSFLNEATV